MYIIKRLTAGAVTAVTLTGLLATGTVHASTTAVAAGQSHYYNLGSLDWPARESTPRYAVGYNVQSCFKIQKVTNNFRLGYKVKIRRTGDNKLLWSKKLHSAHNSVCSPWVRHHGKAYADVSTAAGVSLRGVEIWTYTN
jgi:hypothetical protein